MRYLIFGDVHGNLPALEELFKFERNSYDQAICHGDVVNYGPWSNECVEFLDTLSDIFLLKGNHEEAFLRGIYPGKNEIAKSFFDFCFPKFIQKEKIRKYGSSFRAGNYVISHTIHQDYFYPDTDLTKYNIKRNSIIGHSHYQFDRKIGEFRIINTGSVGQNRKAINLAEYVIYDDDKDQVKLKSFLFDIDKVIDKMEDDGYPEICLNYYKNKTKI
ncbi:metallophosphoesterase family protein [Salinimicrobium terrae]|uniref:metallophosphoesterase family protein n=1 Tax=Salinimicrobium terrae TaxID=470866 RepID=UPI00048F22DD|nr:metallophosphoesterase [Salinimicrobium terrae]